MPKLRWIRHLKVVFVASAVLLVAGALCGALWLNQRGFEGEWGERIATELAERGIHADFNSVRFSPTRGIIAKEVVVYFDDSRKRVFARIPVLRIEVDRAKALRGELLLRRLILKDADLTLPVGSDRERAVYFEKLSGNATIDRQGRLTLHRATGRLGGMEFKLQVELDEFDLSRLSRQSDTEDSSKRDEFVTSVFKELEEWSFPEALPPRLELRVTGSLLRPSTIRTFFSLQAGELTRRDYTMRGSSFAGDLHGRVLTVDRLSFSDGPGQITVRADFDLEDQEGRCELKSSIKIGSLLRQGFDLHQLDDLVPVQAPKVEASGHFKFGEEGLDLGLIGSVELQSFRFLGNPFEGLATEFSWQNGDLFLRELSVKHEKGELSDGQILMQDDRIRYRASSTMPVSVYNAFIRKESALDRILSRSAFTDRSRVQINAHGNIMRSDLKNWVARGDATIENYTYNGVPLESTTAKFDVTPLDSVFTDVRGIFDYGNYVMRQRYGGPRTALVRADRIHTDHTDKLVRLTNLRGTIWPGPMLRLFTPRIATYIEDTYGMRSPPELATSGVIDARKPGRRTDLTTRCRANSATSYEFLGKVVQLDNVACKVRTRYSRNDVSGLSFRTFGGSGAGNVTVRHPPGKRPTFDGGFRWDNLVLARIGRTYGFEKAKQGSITGRIDFSGASGSTRALNGTGVVGLRNGHLFYVPAFGPLSAPIGGVIGNKKFSHEEARDASATFVIKNGVAYTNDFLTSTPSSVFTGEGKVDLNTKRLDMTVRMNARGLLGLITLPLRPFNGLFQFRGQGPISNPKWGSAPFTEPPRGRDDPIFRKPPRARIVRER